MGLGSGQGPLPCLLPDAAVAAPASAGGAGALAGPGDVVRQCGSLGFEFAYTDLHHIADAHDPLQAAITHDHLMPDPRSVIMRMTSSIGVCGVTVCTSAV